jgi:hypothetical protein
MTKHIEAGPYQLAERSVKLLDECEYRQTGFDLHSSRGFFLAAFDDDATLLAAIAGNAAFFLYQFLEVVSLQSRRVETFRTEAIFQIVAGKRQMTVTAA